eukprot:scaffold325083_cov54-Tisochrysis_lutea.AAC.1
MNIYNSVEYICECGPAPGCHTLTTPECRCRPRNVQLLLVDHAHWTLAHEAPTATAKRTSATLHFHLHTECLDISKRPTHISRSTPDQSSHSGLAQDNERRHGRKPRGVVIGYGVPPCIRTRRSNGVGNHQHLMHNAMSVRRQWQRRVWSQGPLQGVRVQAAGPWANETPYDSVGANGLIALPPVPCRHALFDLMPSGALSAAPHERPSPFPDPTPPR